jgi:hypothetical protein
VSILLPRHYLYILYIARRLSSHTESGTFDGGEGDGNHVHSSEPEDPLDRLRFSENLSESPDDNNYEPNIDNGGDDNESDEEDNDVSDDGISDHDTHATPSSCGKKRARSNSDTDNDSTFKRARKLVKSKGRPKAGDYADDVQDVLDNAITHFKVDLLRFGPYPDRTHELAWAKFGWAAANKACSLKIAHNSELIKMVSLLLMTVRSYLYSTS